MPPATKRKVAPHGEMWRQEEECWDSVGPSGQESVDLSVEPDDAALKKCDRTAGRSRKESVAAAG